MSLGHMFLHIRTALHAGACCQQTVSAGMCIMYSTSLDYSLQKKRVNESVQCPICCSRLFRVQNKLPRLGRHVPLITDYFKYVMLDFVYLFISFIYLGYTIKQHNVQSATLCFRFTTDTC